MQAIVHIRGQIEGIQQGVDDGSAAVSVVDRRVIHVGKPVQGNRVVELRIQAIGLGELAYLRVAGAGFDVIPTDCSIVTVFSFASNC